MLVGMSGQVRNLLFATACTFFPVSHAAAAALEDVIVRVKPSIVVVGTFEQLRNPQFQFRGTGFVVGDGTLVATNAHVIPDVIDSSKLESIAIVIPATDAEAAQRREARVLNIDREHDLATLRISGPALPALTLAQNGNVREGQSTAFTGFPIGPVLGLVPVTHRASVSAITPIAIPSTFSGQLNERVVRQLQSGAFRVLQLDGTAYPGNSGSPLYDAGSGEVIGVLNMVFIKTTKEAILSQPSGISFAMPVEHLRKLLEPTR